MADDLKTSLKAVLDLLEAGVVSDDMAVMMLQAAIMKQTQAPAYIAFQAAYRAYVDRRQEVETRRARLVAVDSPAYQDEQAKDSAG